MSKCIICEKWAGLFFTKQVAAETLQKAIASGITRDPQLLTFYHKFWHIDAVRKVIETGVDPDSDKGKRAIQMLEDDLVNKIVAFNEDKLIKKGGGPVCRGCFNKLARYVP